MPPSPLNPSSRSAVPTAAAEGGHGAAASEKTWITLLEWWLANVEGDDQKIAVAGFFERDQRIRELSPTPIAKRPWPHVVVSEDGTVLQITGSFNTSRTLGNGYSNTVILDTRVQKDHSVMHCSHECLDLDCKPCMQVCKHFDIGFPYWWQSCNQRYPKQKNSGTRCQPCPSNISSSGVNSTHYLEKFHLGSSSRNDSESQKSRLSNGTPRFEVNTCDGDIVTNDNIATSNEAGKGDQRTPLVTLEVRGCREETQHMALTEKAAVDEVPTSVCLDVQHSLSLSNGTPILEEYTCDGDIPTNEDAAASNDDNGRYTGPSKLMNNMEIGLVTGSPSRDRGHDDNTTDVSLAPTVENTDNAISEAVDSNPATDCKKTPVRCLKNQVSWGGNQQVASHKKPVGRPNKQISSHGKCQNPTSSPGIRSPVSYVPWSPLTRGKAMSFSMSTPEALKLKRSRSGRVIVPKLDLRYQSIVYGRETEQLHASNMKYCNLLNAFFGNPYLPGGEAEDECPCTEFVHILDPLSQYVIEDGSIAAVIGLDSPAMPKGSESKPGRRKKGRPQ